MRFGVVDLSNLFYRARHGVVADAETKVALAQHVLFRGLRKLHRQLNLDHIVFAVDQGSWRHAVYPAYKSRRRLEQTSEQEENRLFSNMLRDLIHYLAEQTRCTVLQANDIEGDDFIARWIARHPADDHVIISNDSDYVQLLAPNVRMFDAINNRLIAVEAVIDESGRKLSFIVSPKDGKLRVGPPDETFDPEPLWWRKALFIKLIRGDSTDSIFGAYPGVRYEGKKCSIRAAWEDTDQGYDWNNLMCQTWSKLIEIRDGQRVTREVRVLDEYRNNESLIDLTKQPDWVVRRMDDVIDGVCRRSPVANVGIHFIRFCTKRDLPELVKEANDHVVYLNGGYNDRDCRH